MRNIRYGFEQLFRRLSKTVSIVFFIDFTSKFDFSQDYKVIQQIEYKV